MKFTNVTSAGFYLQCCHREVEPGGSFSVPWESGKSDRGLRAAMAAGRLAWVPESGEAEVPGSPAMPDVEGLRRKAAEAESARAEAVRRRSESRRAEAAADLGEQMSRMGNYAVPQPVKRSKRSRSVSKEAPVTSADVIASGDRPKSLEAIRRHNRAVRRS